MVNLGTRQFRDGGNIGGVGCSFRGELNENPKLLGVKPHHRTSGLGAGGNMAAQNGFAGRSATAEVDQVEIDTERFFHPQHGQAVIAIIGAVDGNLAGLFLTLFDQVLKCFDLAVRTHIDRRRVDIHRSDLIEAVDGEVQPFADDQAHREVGQVGCADRIAIGLGAGHEVQHLGTTGAGLVDRGNFTA